MDGHGGMDLLGEHFDPSAIGRMREDEYESRSGSDNFEGGSGDDQEANEDGPPRKKKYNRHTPHQIQELENFFKECPHPDEKQRLELSRRLGLESKQIKFWFQNRRTQMKTQLERHENVILRQENEKLQAENDLLKEAMRSPICNTCGGQAIPGDISYEQHQLRIENARFKDELNRICALANKFLGKPLASSVNPISTKCLNSNLELAVGRNGFGGVSTAGTTLPMGHDFGDGDVMPMMKPMMGVTSNDIQFERSMLIDLALAAMDELCKMAHTDNPLWIKSFDEGKEVLNLEEYMRTFSPCIGMKPVGFVTEATRDTGLVMVNSLALVETMMDANRWAEMFPSVVARASTIDMVSTDTGGTKNNALQVMHAEFQLLSPLVPVRQVKFLRFCKQHAEGLWAVVDVSIDMNQVGSNTQFVTCRRLPSGCVVQDMPNGYSKVIWVEHSEYDESSVHHLYRPLLSSGMGFGAHRWISALQSTQLTISIKLPPPSSEKHSITPGGKRSMLKLAQRMTNNFCAGVCASSMRKWDKLRVENMGEDVRVLTRKRINDPGEPPGVVLSAATSVWMPVSRQRLFNFLRDERMRSAWDILSNGGPMHEMVHIAKGQGTGSCVSLLSANAISKSENTMLILQETWSDVSGSLVVYAPVDIPSMHIVMNGGDSAYVALLPSGFAILPPPNHGGWSNNINGTIVKPEVESDESGGCLLTVGFQILVNSLPTAKLTVESVETVNNLISCTIHKIKDALQVT
ncbi:Homeobox domain-containing protein/START domain-containing protein [Cephalotus follicularis]|uniref:Homeobox domain-containing protein/START domain-containing protein n=1 Tax=Cephalotus follicularis TaxID=3775 RepID=A0A1Q3CYE9_CEPFO|nr:Homeobox domain-containing protein/START domain-containing protein [Cephalotus follicularis]